MDKQVIKIDPFFSRELFIETIAAIEQQDRHDREHLKKLLKLYPGIDEAYDNHWLNNQLMKLLQTEFPSNSEICDIEYFMGKLNFGRKYKPGCVTVNDKDIDFSDAGKLYDFLINQ